MDKRRSHLHQGWRLAGAVLAPRGMDLALPTVKLYVVPALHAREGFADASQFQSDGHSGSPAVGSVQSPQLIAPSCNIHRRSDFLLIGLVDDHRLEQMDGTPHPFFVVVVSFAVTVLAAQRRVHHVG